MKSIVKCNLWHNHQRGESDQYLIEEEIEDHIHMIMRDNTDWNVASFLMSCQRSAIVVGFCDVRRIRGINSSHVYSIGYMSLED